MYSSLYPRDTEGKGVAGEESSFPLDRHIIHSCTTNGYSKFHQNLLIDDGEE